MATIELTEDTLTVKLTAFERVEALHASVSVPRSSVVAARGIEDVMDEVHGLRAPGTGVPGVVMIGTLRDHGVTTFAECHGHRPGVLIELKSQDFDRLLISLDDAEHIVDELAR